MRISRPLWQIIQKLREEEAEVCRTYLTAFDRRGGKFQGKSEKLFMVLLEDKAGKLSDNELQEILYEKEQPDAFKKLVHRLKSKVLEVLLMDINLERAGAYSARSRTVSEIRKRLSQAQILQARSLVQISISMYDSIINDGIKYEIWEETLTALRAKRAIVGLSKGKHEYKQISYVWKVCQNSSKASIHAESCYYMTAITANYRKWNEEDNNWLRDKIIRIRENYERTKSFTVEYFLKLLEVFYYQQHKLYSKSEEGLRRLVYLASKADAVSSAPRHSSALLNLAENNLYQGNYSGCIYNANEAFRVVTSTHITALRCRELQFYAWFYQGSYSKALSIIEKTISNAEESGWAFQKGKWIYLKACAHFAMGEFGLVEQLLIEINPIESDKEGYNLGLRILLVLTSIETAKYDLSGHRIETLRKHLGNTENDGIHVKRERVIYEICRELERQSFDFKATKELVAEKIHALENGSSSLKWEALSSEMIVFTEWFHSKCSGKEFNQTIPVYVEPQHALRLVV